MKSLRGIWLLFLVGLFLVAGKAWARTCDDHVYVNPEGKGSVLLYPIYVANDGLSTRIEVVNTSPTQGVVAKVVIRSHVYSQEVRDFFIYLSPNDYWAGTIYFNGATGEPTIQSTDDSITCGGGVFEWPLVPPCADNTQCRPDDSLMGYVEVFEAAAYDWDDVQAWAVAHDLEDATHCQQLKAYYDAQAGPQPVADVLIGRAEVKFPGDYVEYPAVALANYQFNEKLAISQGGIETSFLSPASSNICEVEAAIARDEVYVSYYHGSGGDTLAIFTYPTKLASCPQVIDDVCVYSVRNAAIRGGFFADNANYNVAYGLRFFNDSEETVVREACEVSPCPQEETPTMPDEVNIVGTAGIPADFVMGWARFTFGQSTTCTNAGGEALSFSGAPVLPVVVHILPNGQMAVLVPPYDAGDVSCGGEVAEAYQVSKSYLGAGQEEGGQEGGQGGQGGPQTEIDGQTVTCDTDCGATFAGNIQNIIQCNVWQENNCQ